MRISDTSGFSALIEEVPLCFLGLNISIERANPGNSHTYLDASVRALAGSIEMKPGGQTNLNTLSLKRSVQDVGDHAHNAQFKLLSELPASVCLKNVSPL